MAERQLIVLERNRLLHALSIALLVLGPIGLLLSATHVFVLGFFGGHLTALGLLLRTTLVRHNHRPTRRSRRVTTSGDGVSVDGQVVLRHDAIANGYFQPRYGAASSVRLTDARKRIVFEAATASEEEAHAILSELSLDARTRRAEFRGGSPLFATVARQTAVVLGSVLFGVVAAMLHLRGFGIPQLAVMFVVLAALVPSKITVGVDGILYRWLGYQNFIPMSELVDARVEAENVIVIRLRTGTERVLSTSVHNKRGNSPIARTHRDAILARIREAKEVYDADATDAEDSALFARGARSAKEWLAALAMLARGEGNYRQASVRADDLLRVVEDASLPEDARAGAAVVLGAMNDAVAKTRVRVAADAAASPRLRVALDAASSGKTDELEEVLEKLEVARAHNIPPRI